MDAASELPGGFWPTLIVLALVAAVWIALDIWRRRTRRGRLDTAGPPVATPPGHVRLHLFAGTFDDDRALFAHTIAAPDDRHPQPFTDDLPEAFIDTDFVEIATGPRIGPTLATYLPPSLVAELRNRISPRNAVVLVLEEAMGGFPYRLHDTPRLEYLGAFEGRRPEA